MHLCANACSSVCKSEYIKCIFFFIRIWLAEVKTSENYKRIAGSGCIFNNDHDSNNNSSLD